VIMSDPRRVTGIVIVALLLVAGGFFVYMRTHAEKTTIGEILRSPDRFDDSYVLLDGKVTPGAPHFDGILIGYYGGFELDDGTGKVGIHFDDHKVAAPAVGAHVTVKARAERPQQATTGANDLPSSGKMSLALVAESIDVQ
jgi:hypothetical protein